MAVVHSSRIQEAGLAVLWLYWAGNSVRDRRGWTGVASVRVRRSRCLLNIEVKSQKVHDPCDMAIPDMPWTAPRKIFCFSNGLQLSTPDLTAPKLPETVAISPEALVEEVEAKDPGINVIRA